MQQSEISSSYYQYYQSHVQTPNPSPNTGDPQLSPLPPTFASAPPLSSSYSPSDFSDYSSIRPPYSQTPDNVPELTPIASAYPSNPNSLSSNFSQPYSFPHLVPQQTPNYLYDQNQTALNYDHSDPNYNSNPNSSLSMTSYSSASYGHSGDSTVPNYKNPYESSVNFGGYEAQGIYGEIGGPRPDIGLRYDHERFPDNLNGGGAYRYHGGNAVPYGDRGSGSKGSTGVIFDDYGRPVGFTDGKEENHTGSLSKIMKAVPKTEMQQDSKSGVQKFRVKLLSEGGGQSDMDVLCQIGLDGIQILDPATCRTLRIYPLETVTRWDVLDSYIFALWAKSSIDIEPRRIRLKSNSYTTNNILDTVTAATIQLKEIGGRSKPSYSLKVSEQPSEKKKGFADWMKMKPVNEEKDHWVPDEVATRCTDCGTDFGAFVRKHHCRNCGDIFCDKCTQGRIALTADEYAQPVRVCDQCLAEVTQRLSNTKETAGKVAELKSHEDLAKKLQEEMDKNCKISTGPKSDGSGMQMKEVACPTCTVHLQVQVPASGSETVECSVCQNPFLVSAC